MTPRKLFVHQLDAQSITLGGGWTIPAQIVSSNWFRSMTSDIINTYEKSEIFAFAKLRVPCVSPLNSHNPSRVVNNNSQGVILGIISCQRIALSSHSLRSYELVAPMPSDIHREFSPLFFPPPMAFRVQSQPSQVALKSRVSNLHTTSKIATTALADLVCYARCSTHLYTRTTRFFGQERGLCTLGIDTWCKKPGGQHPLSLNSTKQILDFTSHCNISVEVSSSLH